MVVREGDSAHTNGADFPKWNRALRSPSPGEERTNGADMHSLAHGIEERGRRDKSKAGLRLVYECPIMLLICKRSSGVSPTNSNPERTLEVCRTMATVVTG